MSEPPPRYPLLFVDAAPDEVDALIGRLTLLGAEGIEERDATTLSKPGARGVTLVASFPTRAAAEAAVADIGANARIEEIVGDAWRDAWREHWRATRLGTRIVIVPSWVEYQAVPGDLVLALDPGRAFGTGQHASTALVVELLETLVTAGQRAPLIDIGCGSGILSFVALALGVERAIACDTDPDAVSATRENAARLGFADRIDVRVGSVGAVDETSSLVVANIEAPVLVPLARELAARVDPGGTIVLSGILEPQRAEVERAYRDVGLVASSARARDGWVALAFARPGGRERTA